MRIHFIGIGGIGVSALAQYYLQKGHDISGSDLVASEITEFLATKGIAIMAGNMASNISKEMELVIHSPAVKADNAELVQAQKLGIKTITYPEALGGLTREYETIAISGAHGKSTTTAMIGLMLVEAGIDPTVIVGTKLKEFGGTNFRMGNSKYLVIEACEYDGSFLNYSPKITVITNLDKEHMDYFKTFARVVKTFKDFIMRLPEDGFLVANKDDKQLAKISKGKFKVIPYGLGQKEAGKLKKILQVPGKHNISNALAALKVGRILGVSDEVIFSALGKFNGTWRRFETKESQVSGVKVHVISDYGHHPNEVMVTLQAVREKYKKKTVWLIFQPHQYQRTHYLFADFVKLFKKVPINQIFITDIYDVAGRETQSINSRVSAEKLVEKIKKPHVQYVSLEAAEERVKEGIGEGDVVVIMGAGDVYKLFDRF